MGRDVGDLRFCRWCKLHLPASFVHYGRCKECPKPALPVKAVPYVGERLFETKLYWTWWWAVWEAARGTCACGAKGKHVMHDPSLAKQLSVLGLEMLEQALAEGALWTVGAGKVFCTKCKPALLRDARYPWLYRRRAGRL